MNRRRCFFIGHREAPDDIRDALKKAIERQIKGNGVTEFLVGHYGGFDLMAANAVIEAKARHSDIELLLLLPYHPAECPIKLPKGFDGSFYPSGMERVPRRAAIARANRLAVQESECLIAYAWHPASNARELVEYALRREKRGLISVLNLAHFHDETGGRDG